MEINGMGMSSLYQMQQSQKPSSEDMASNILSELDTDGDGALSTDEISAGGDMAQNILGADADGDGYVTEDELVTDIESMGAGEMPPPPPPGEEEEDDEDSMVTSIIDELDTNGDGVLSMSEILAGGEIAQNILGADSDGDGSVTSDELSADIATTKGSSVDFTA